MREIELRVSRPPETVGRRDMLRRCGFGLGVLAAADLLANEDAVANDGALNADKSAGGATTGGVNLPLAPKKPHFAARAERVVHLFMNGGPSQVDTFDPKPLLDQYHGKPLPTQNLRTERKTGAAMRSPFKFQKYGQSGLEVSELFAKTAQHIDELCVIRSMTADVPNHEPSLMLMNCGEGRQSRPSMGSWVTYGLGSENQNLPGFIAMCPGGYPIVSTQNWRSSFLPGAYQGTYIDSQHTDVDKLIANIRNPRLSPEAQRRQLDLLKQLNDDHLRERAAAAPLEARLQTFELAYRMQSEAVEAFDFNREPQWVKDAYGPGTQARQLLITRRLLERGVRFVQVWSGAGQPWDNHSDLEKQHKDLCGQWDQPIAAFLSDLKQRGLLDSTLVLWGGEFGRTPVAELPQLNGRDHNHYGFTCWLAGGGVRGGYAHGATDEFGFRAVEKPVHVHDLHATMMHLLGFDHERLTYRYAGRDYRLTDIHGKVVSELIA
ncbi:MAG: DUF1501 domain-containing protein [Pirellulales bacterium]